MKIRRHFMLTAIIFMAIAFLRVKASAYDMTQYLCSLNQGDWWEGLYTYSVVGGPND